MATAFEKETHSSDEEVVDYAPFLPLDRIVSKNFKFAEEPLLKPLLDKKRNEGLTAKDNYWSGATIHLQIEFIESPTDFWFTLRRHADKIKEMNEKMKKIYSVNGPCEYTIPSACVTPRMPVVAVMNGIFSRAYIIDVIIGKNMCTVQPVDGGAPMQVSKKDLRFVHTSLTEYPKFGYHGKLSGVLPRSGSDWTKEATSAFERICLVDTSRRYMVGIVYYFMVNGMVALNLWTTSRKGQEVWAIEELVQRRLAREDPTPSERAPGRALPEKDEQAALLTELMAKAGIGLDAVSGTGPSTSGDTGHKEKTASVIQGPASASAAVQ